MLPLQACLERLTFRVQNFSKGVVCTDVMSITSVIYDILVNSTVLME